MKMQVYAVYDKAVNAFTPPFMVRSRGEALRSFTEACNDEKSNFRKHSMDFAMYYLAEFDDGTGIYALADHGPERIIGANECIVDDDRLAVPPSEFEMRKRM